MGEKAKDSLKLHFDKRLRLEFHGARITSDTGLHKGLGKPGAMSVYLAPRAIRDEDYLIGS